VLNVPNVLNLTVSAADAAIKAAGFNPNNVTVVPDCLTARQKVFTVHDQTPAGGSKAKPTAQFQLTATSDTCIAYPYVTGMDGGQAFKALVAAGFGSGNITMTPCSYGGVVTGESPAYARQYLLPDTKINLTLQCNIG
jgi:beta-lactam-binding protein with PASTA domain